jgi:hypothetical protein
MRDRRQASSGGGLCLRGCYAMKGRYRFKNVKDALNRRLNSLTHPQWVEAMTVLVSHYSRKVPFFRWHDSGDLQGAQHLKEYIRSVQRHTAGAALDAHAGSEAIKTHGSSCCTKKFNHSCVLAYDRPGASQVLAPYVDCSKGRQNLPRSGTREPMRQL